MRQSRKMGEEHRVPGTMSRRVAGIWFIWSRWSVPCVWFDERERQRQTRAPDRLPLNGSSPHRTVGSHIAFGVMDTPPSFQ